MYCILQRIAHVSFQAVACNSHDVFTHIYFSGLLHWHWGNDYPSASEVTLENMDRQTTTEHNKA